jgi:hypothetical protein
VAGRYYAIGVGWGTIAPKYYTQEIPLPTFPQTESFGTLTSAKDLPGSVIPVSVAWSPPSTYLYPQKITTGL